MQESQYGDSMVVIHECNQQSPIEKTLREIRKRIVTSSPFSREYVICYALQYGITRNVLSQFVEEILYWEENGLDRIIEWIAAEWDGKGDISGVLSTIRQMEGDKR